MKGWCLGCWSLLQDWANTRWTSSWQETCSWPQTSGSHRDLWEKAFPLYLDEMRHTINMLSRRTLPSCRRERVLPWWCHCEPADLASRLRVWERLTSADSCSRLWKLFLQEWSTQNEDITIRHLNLMAIIDAKTHSQINPRSWRILTHLHTRPTVLCSSCIGACPGPQRWHPARQETATDWSDGLSAPVWTANRCSSAPSYKIYNIHSSILQDTSKLGI